MATLACPFCQHANAAGSLRCGRCGADLAFEDTITGAVRRAAAPPSAGALWLDDLRSAPPPEAGPDTVAADLLTLRALDAVPPAPAAAESPEAAHGTAHHAARAAHRAAVRRARLHDQADAAGSAAEVLAFDPDDGARERLRLLLDAFGFAVHAVPDIGQAWTLVARRHLAAAFVDIALDDRDGGAGIALCRQVKAVSRQRGDATPTLLVLVAAPLRPVERVAAGLAGCDDIVVKPVERGSIARVLDRHGVAMPHDPRRG